MQLQGKIKKVFETQEITPSFKKREFVITTSETYPQDILLEFTKDKCDVLNAYPVGQEVEVHLNIRGREWINPQGEAKYFNTLQAWKIGAVGIANQSNDVNFLDDDSDLPY